MEYNVFAVIKHHKGNIDILKLAEQFQGVATHDQIVKGIWLWLQHNEQE